MFMISSWGSREEGLSTMREVTVNKQACKMQRVSVRTAFSDSSILSDSDTSECESTGTSGQCIVAISNLKGKEKYLPISVSNLESPDVSVSADGGMYSMRYAALVDFNAPLKTRGPHNVTHGLRKSKQRLKSGDEESNESAVLQEHPQKGRQRRTAGKNSPTSGFGRSTGNTFHKAQMPKYLKDNPVRRTPSPETAVADKRMTAYPRFTGGRNSGSVGRHPSPKEKFTSAESETVKQVPVARQARKARRLQQCRRNDTDSSTSTASKIVSSNCSHGQVASAHCPHCQLSSRAKEEPLFVITGKLNTPSLGKDVLEMLQQQCKAASSTKQQEHTERKKEISPSRPRTHKQKTEIDPQQSKPTREVKKPTQEEQHEDEKPRVARTLSRTSQHSKHSSLETRSRPKARENVRKRSHRSASHFRERDSKNNKCKSRQDAAILMAAQSGEASKQEMLNNTTIDSTTGSNTAETGLIVSTDKAGDQKSLPTPSKGIKSISPPKACKPVKSTYEEKLYPSKTEDLEGSSSYPVVYNSPILTTANQNPSQCSFRSLVKKAQLQCLYSHKLNRYYTSTSSRCMKEVRGVKYHKHHPSQNLQNRHNQDTERGQNSTSGTSKRRGSPEGERSQTPKAISGRKSPQNLHTNQGERCSKKTVLSILPKKKMHKRFQSHSCSEKFTSGRHSSASSSSGHPARGKARTKTLSPNRRYPMSDQEKSVRGATPRRRAHTPKGPMRVGSSFKKSMNKTKQMGKKKSQESRQLSGARLESKSDPEDKRCKGKTKKIAKQTQSNADRLEHTKARNDVSPRQENVKTKENSPCKDNKSDDEEDTPTCDEVKPRKKKSPIITSKSPRVLNAEMQYEKKSSGKKSPKSKRKSAVDAKTNVDEPEQSTVDDSVLVRCRSFKTESGRKSPERDESPRSIDFAVATGVPSTARPSHQHASDDNRVLSSPQHKRNTRSPILPNPNDFQSLEDKYSHIKSTRLIRRKFGGISNEYMDHEGDTTCDLSDLTYDKSSPMSKTNFYKSSHGRILSKRDPEAVHSESSGDSRPSGLRNSYILRDQWNKLTAERIYYNGRSHPKGAFGENSDLIENYISSTFHTDCEQCECREMESIVSTADATARQIIKRGLDRYMQKFSKLLNVGSTGIRLRRTGLDPGRNRRLPDTPHCNDKRLKNINSDREAWLKYGSYQDPTIYDRSYNKIARPVPPTLTASMSDSCLGKFFVSKCSRIQQDGCLPPSNDPGRLTLAERKSNITKSIAYVTLSEKNPAITTSKNSVLSYRHQRLPLSGLGPEPSFNQEMYFQNAGTPMPVSSHGSNCISETHSAPSKLDNTLAMSEIEDFDIDHQAALSLSQKLSANRWAMKVDSHQHQKLLMPRQEIRKVPRRGWSYPARFQRNVEPSMTEPLIKPPPNSPVDELHFNRRKSAELESSRRPLLNKELFCETLRQSDQTGRQSRFMENDSLFKEFVCYLYEMGRAHSQAKDRRRGDKAYSWGEKTRNNNGESDDEGPLDLSMRKVTYPLSPLQILFAHQKKFGKWSDEAPTSTPVSDEEPLSPPMPELPCYLDQRQQSVPHKQLEQLDPCDQPLDLTWKSTKNDEAATEIKTLTNDDAAPLSTQSAPERWRHSGSPCSLKDSSQPAEQLNQPTKGVDVTQPFHPLDPYLVTINPLQSGDACAPVAHQNVTNTYSSLQSSPLASRNKYRHSVTYNSEDSRFRVRTPHAAKAKEASHRYVKTLPFEGAQAQLTNLGSNMKQPNGAGDILDLPLNPQRLNHDNDGYHSEELDLSKRQIGSNPSSKCCQRDGQNKLTLPCSESKSENGMLNQCFGHSWNRASLNLTEKKTDAKDGKNELIEAVKDKDKGDIPSRGSRECVNLDTSNLKAFTREDSRRPYSLHRHRPESGGLPMNNLVHNIHDSFNEELYNQYIQLRSVLESLLKNHPLDETASNSQYSSLFNAARIADLQIPLYRPDGIPVNQARFKLDSDTLGNRLVSETSPLKADISSQASSSDDESISHSSTDVSSHSSSRGDVSPHCYKSNSSCSGTRSSSSDSKTFADSFYSCSSIVPP